MAATGPDAPCGLCGAASPPYTCPRCNRRLCSLRCYRGHGSCSEAFYRRQVLEELENRRGSPAERRRLASAFRRLRLSSEAEDPAEAPGGRGLWGLLSPEERTEFRRLLSSGEAAKLLPPWRPWWWRRRRPRELPEEDEDDAEETPAPLPAFPTSIPPLRSLRAPPPSPLLRFQLPNVLYGYVFALALHAGDERLLPELPVAAVAASAALRGAGAVFTSTVQALEAARRDAAAAGYPPCGLGTAGTVLAVAELLEGSGGGGGRSGGGDGRRGRGRGDNGDSATGAEDDGDDTTGAKDDGDTGDGDTGDTGHGDTGDTRDGDNGDGDTGDTGHGDTGDTGHGDTGDTGDGDNGDTPDGDNGDTSGGGAGATGANWAVLLALGHLEQLLLRSRHRVAPGSGRRLLGSARHKLRFLLAWSREQPPETLWAMAREARDHYWAMKG